jgi:TusE/DsrC/DsvC family sulfur relay protein
MAIENRKYVRYVIRQSALLITDHYKTIGFTRDLSIRGLLFIPEKEVRVKKNQTGTLKLEIDNSIISVPCTIRNISDKGIGIGIAMEALENRHVEHLATLLESTLKLNANGHTIDCTPDNRLVNLSDWSEATANALAKREGIELTEEHWSIIKIMRDYYNEYRLCPSEKVITNYILKHLSAEQALDSFIYNLFPSGLVIQATRLSGIPLPLEDHIIATFERQKLLKTKSNLQLVATETVTFENHEYHFTIPGNLIEQNLWNERLAIFIAKCHGLELNHSHWEIIHFLRYFYSEFSIVPNVIVLKKHLLEEENEEWKDKVNDEYLYGLFPKGPCRQGAIIGGLPEPKDCID